MLCHKKVLRGGLMILVVMALAAVGAVTIGAGKGRPVTYTMTILPRPDGAASIRPFAMNNSGDVVGIIDLPGGGSDGFLYTAKGETVNMNDFPNLPDGWHIGVAYGINDSGQIAGVADFVDSDGKGRPHVFRYTPATGMYEVPKAMAGHPVSYAAAINANGDVAGTAESDFQPGQPTSQRAFVWLWGQPTTTPLIDDVSDDLSQARGINSHGEVTGFRHPAPGQRAFRYTPGAIEDLGVLPRRLISYGYGINNNGDVVGESSGGKAMGHAFLCSRSGVMVDLGALWSSFSKATAVNNKTPVQVVGQSATSLSTFHGFLYTASSGMWDLASLTPNPPPGVDWRETVPWAINDNPLYTFGQITGTVTVNGKTEAFLMTPVPPTTPGP
jgi:probable HAF family extracellular repeat protein